MRDLRNIRYKGNKNKNKKTNLPRNSIIALVVILLIGAGIMILIPKVKKGRLSPELIPGQIITKEQLQKEQEVLPGTDNTSNPDSFTFYKALSSKEDDVVPLSEENVQSVKKEEVELNPPREEELKKIDNDIAKHAEKKKEESDIYSVQVAALSKESKANEIISNLRGKGYAPYIIKEENKRGGGLFKIRVGRFHSLVDAQEVAQVLRKDGYDTYVIKVDVLKSKEVEKNK